MLDFKNLGCSYSDLHFGDLAHSVQFFLLT